MTNMIHTHINFYCLVCELFAIQYHAVGNIN